MLTASQTNDDERPGSSVQRAVANSRQVSVGDEDYWLDVALQDSFPCSDPISSMRSD
jgi:hypothetical protein